jgi:hypothetical protein
MSVEPRQALYAHLSADPDVVAAVGSNIHQRRVPEGAPKPLIVIWPPQSRVPERDLDGPAYYRTRIQLTVMAATQPEAEKVARAVIAAVEGFAGLMAGVLPVLLVEVIDDSQIDQSGIDEIHHHVILRIAHK